MINSENFCHELKESAWDTNQLKNFWCDECGYATRILKEHVKDIIPDKCPVCHSALNTNPATTAYISRPFVKANPTINGPIYKDIAILVVEEDGKYSSAEIAYSTCQPDTELTVFDEVKELTKEKIKDIGISVKIESHFNGNKLSFRLVAKFNKISKNEEDESFFIPLDYLSEVIDFLIEYDIPFSISGLQGDMERAKECIKNLTEQLELYKTLPDEIKLMIELDDSIADDSKISEDDSIQLTPKFIHLTTNYKQKTAKK